MAKSRIIGPDGELLDMPEPTPRLMVEFYAWAVYGYSDPDCRDRSGGVMDNTSASEAEDCGFESRLEHFTTPVSEAGS